MGVDTIRDIYRRLYDRFGPQHWWPGDGRFEIIVGAILTQNTNWTNVERAIERLRQAGVLCPEAMAALPIDTLAEHIRPAGYYNLKARRLKAFLTWLFDRFGGDLTGPDRMATVTLREELLDVSGIGPETADSILLYAFERAVFVVDAYTARIAARHGLIELGTDYESLRSVFEDALPPDVTLFNEYHALLVRVGKAYCKRRPRCTGCPLEDLPHEIDPM
ncbi:MAG TPA: endonuclease III domain-containing protein [Phycisphaerales bacterium]|nr:endonuclease III domain-containing protein [Phycisphaerales bacterium]